MCETYSEDLIPGPLILRAWAVSYTYVSVCVCVCVPAQLGQACEPACHWRVLVCIQKKGGGEARRGEEKVEGGGVGGY